MENYHYVYSTIYLYRRQGRALRGPPPGPERLLPLRVQVRGHGRQEEAGEARYVSQVFLVA